MSYTGVYECYCELFTEQAATETKHWCGQPCEGGEVEGGKESGRRGACPRGTGPVLTQLSNLQQSVTRPVLGIYMEGRKVCPAMPTRSNAD